jgi:prepilin-type N-terminal cleavage/methylation domain-containing protein
MTNTHKQAAGSRQQAAGNAQPCSLAAPCPLPAARPAFTLIELLVVIGIIVLLMGLLIPAILHALNTGKRTRTEADLHLIETALEAYKSDFADYPRFVSAADDQANAGTNSIWLDYRQDRGAVLLCRALLGPSPAGDLASVDLTSSTEVGADGADGPGFRTRRTMSGTPPTVSGKVWGPYIQSDKFKLGGTDTNYFTDATLLDNQGNPILYYPATPNTTSFSQPGTFVTVFNPSTNQNTATSAATPYPLYNAFDNAGSGTTGTPPYLAASQLEFILGERSTASQTGGNLVSPDTATYTGPYLLWTAGQDGFFGFGNDPTTNLPRVAPFVGSVKTDDVTNFEIPTGLRK